jgi:hypothetical protein
MSLWMNLREEEEAETGKKKGNRIESYFGFMEF